MLIHRALASAGLAVLFGVISFAAVGDPGPRGPSTNVPSGLVVVIENKSQRDQLDLTPLSNPVISGVALQVRWRDIEPVQGKPDWSKLDELFAAAESSKKWVHLLVFPGFFSPEWALEGTKNDQFAIQYGPGAGTVQTLPMPWDTVYLNRWFKFLNLLGDKYGKSPAFRLIGAAGPTSVSVEFTLPKKPGDISKWQSDGYTPRKYIGAWQKVFQAYATVFPNQFVSLSLGTGLGIDERGKIDHQEVPRTRKAIIEQGMAILGRRFVLQCSDLSAGPVQRTGPDFVIGYSERIITGLQMRTSCTHNSGDMGAEGNPALALKKSIEEGMRANNSGQHINYLEIYEPDVVAEDMQPVLRYGASLFARQ